MPSNCNCKHFPSRPTVPEASGSLYATRKLGKGVPLDPQEDQFLFFFNKACFFSSSLTEPQARVLRMGEWVECGYGF